MSEPNRKDPLVEILTWAVVAIVTLCLLALVLRPILFRPHFTSGANACINNLRQIDAAADEFALENNRTNGDAIRFPSDLTPYIKLNSAGKIPSCPAGGKYSIAKVGDTPTCSLSNTIVPAHVLP